MKTIITKICTKCKIERNIDEFSKNKLKKYGVNSHCKPCKKLHYNENKKHYSEKSKKYYLKNSEKIKKISNNYYYKNTKKINETRKKYLKNNKEKINLYWRKYKKNRRSTDYLFTIKNNIGRSIRQSFKRYGYTKKSKIFEILGCDYETFKKHIELQFIDGMSWNVIDNIHIDHIIPVSSAKNENEMILLNHYLNLQPLWAKENMSKGAKLPTPIEKNKIELSIAKEKGLKLTQQSIF